jgi:hypothetical protein
VTLRSSENVQLSLSYSEEAPAVLPPVDKSILNRVGGSIDAKLGQGALVKAMKRVDRKPIQKQPARTNQSSEEVGRIKISKIRSSCNQQLGVASAWTPTHPVDINPPESCQGVRVLFCPTLVVSTIPSQDWQT